ncbi:MAG: replication factor C large subunit, partial [Candidatus Methanomarinus sp.]
MNIEHPEWAEKYRPKNLQDIAGHNKIVQDLLKWAREWDKESPKDKALILYGKPGVGKTSFVHALAYQMEWDKIELNASDQRTAGIIKKVAGSASKMGTFDGISGKRLVILDEADNLHGNYDRGGARAIIQVIKQSSQPIILIANEFYNVEPALRLSCKAVQFKALNSSSIVSVLKNICIK